MFVSGGLNVYPAEIERVIGGIPGVAAAAVVARPDARWGEVGVAFVDADPDRITADDVIAAVRAELSDYKVPRAVVVERDALPRTVSGKVIKPALKERARVTAENSTTRS
jgi:fatty-acyl-CoA synthase